ncbi:MAG: peptidoglycan editing factor PgeF [Burkholderiaceae bacterium]
MNLDPDWLTPDWSVAGVGALMTTRRGGVSTGAFGSLNLRAGIGDDAAAVARNQTRLEQAIGFAPVYLDQVHGARVVRLGPADLHAEAASAPAPSPAVPRHQADASVTTVPGVVCTVQVADCLPVLFAAPHARAVGAAHAGWRGLAGGVLENTVRAVCEAAACAPGELQVWLGACIGPRRFEVGADVLGAFGASAAAPDPLRFVPHASGKWLANLPQLARDRLQATGVNAIGGGRWCTVEDASRFFSFRRDRVTGRMVAAVWIEAPRHAG